VDPLLADQPIRIAAAGQANGSPERIIGVVRDSMTGPRGRRVAAATAA
jgi:hypothetical protein